MAQPALQFLCNNTQERTLAAGVAETFDIPINGAKDWKTLLRNTGANPITSGTYAESMLGTNFTDATAIASGLPLAAGANVFAAEGQDEVITTLRLTFTSLLGTSLALETGGW